jgi:beta propeller repeat protein/parallel beta-helix repeat protein
VWLEHLNIDKDIPEDWHNMPYNIAGADITNFNDPVYFTIAENVGTRNPYPYNNYDTDFNDVIDISGNIVVYEANGDIYGADISNLDDIILFAICTDPAIQSDPAISGNYVVWTDGRNDEGDIYGADISNIDDIQELEIVKASGNQQQPAIDGTLVVYIDGSSERGQIRVSCITKQFGAVEIPFYFYSPYGIKPAIDGDNIIWQIGTRGSVEGISLEFGYSFLGGLVENLTSGMYYDYIQHAIVSASEGDYILVNEGIYHEKINFKGKNITVSSKEPNNPAVIAATVLTSDGQIVTFSNNEDANSILCGFTITGGNRGIYGSNASPSIQNCNIYGNFSAGISLYDESKPIITHCSIVANTGSGIEMRPRKSGRKKYYNYPNISNCIIAANNQYGIFGGNPTITNCTISDNPQGGIYDNFIFTVVTNSIIYNNGDGSVTAQIYDDRSIVTYSNIQGSWQGDDNIDADPLFADSDSGDYHLKSEAGRWDPISQSWIEDTESSPCIDAGDPNSDIGLEPNPNGSIINMGAYGGTIEASKSITELNEINLVFEEPPIDLQGMKQ